MRLSPNFQSGEFACRHCGRSEVAPELVEHLELLRTIVGGPCVIVSGYRCPEHNRAVGGARKSQHMLGKAADLRPGYATIEQAQAAGFAGIGSKGRFAVHVDVRAGRRARWRY